MKDSRAGEALWKEWEGDGYNVDEGAVVFFTEEHVDVEHEIVRRALASALQREGVACSLGDAYRLLDRAIVAPMYVGSVDNDTVYTVCSKDGETHYGDKVDSILEVTLVEVSSE